MFNVISLIKKKRFLQKKDKINRKIVFSPLLLIPFSLVVISSILIKSVQKEFLHSDFLNHLFTGVLGYFLAIFIFNLFFWDLNLWSSKMAKLRDFFFSTFGSRKIEYDINSCFSARKKNNFFDKRSIITFFYSYCSLVINIFST